VIKGLGGLGVLRVGEISCMGKSRYSNQESMSREKDRVKRAERGGDLRVKANLEEMGVNGRKRTSRNVSF